MTKPQYPRVRKLRQEAKRIRNFTVRLSGYDMARLKAVSAITETSPSAIAYWGIRRAIKYFSGEKTYERPEKSQEPTEREVELLFHRLGIKPDTEEFERIRRILLGNKLMFVSDGTADTPKPSNPWGFPDDIPDELRAILNLQKETPHT